jgi:putative addiction module killer protein
MQVLEYLDPAGKSLFGGWFDGLDAQAAAKVAIGLTRLRDGNLSNVKGVGAGVLEYRLDFGPGYRIYLGRDGQSVIILLGGGTKQRQERDIAAAQARWADYKQRKNA